MRHLKTTIQWATLLAMYFCLASFRLIDAKSPNPNRQLQDLAPYLDKYEIDVLQSNLSNVRINADRTILAPLSNWQETHKSNINFQEAWTVEFREGYTGGIAAVEGNVDKNTFLEKWYAIGEERRIFISFASLDKEKAYIVKNALESKGYVVFVYLNEAGSIGQTAKETGAMMSSAGQHYIIDSKNARKSHGVAFESQMLETLYHPKLPEIVVYGRDECGRTSSVRDEYAEENVRVIYKNIDKDKSAGEFVMKNSRYLEDNMLPLVTVNGRCIRAIENRTLTRLFYQSINNYKDIENMYPAILKGQKTVEYHKPTTRQKSPKQLPPCR